MIKTEVTTSCDGFWRLKSEVGELRISTVEVQTSAGEFGVGRHYVTSIKHSCEPQHEGYVEITRTEAQHVASVENIVVGHDSHTQGDHLVHEAIARAVEAAQQKFVDKLIKKGWRCRICPRCKLFAIWSAPR